MPSVPLPSPSYSTGRHTPYYTHPDVRIYELNRRLQHRIEDADNVWWDAFAAEFFDDDATLTLSFCLEDGPKRYSIGRNLIPRYFRSIFEGGVKELYYHIVQPKETFHNSTSTITLDCENTTMVTHHKSPVLTKLKLIVCSGLVLISLRNQVCTEGRLLLEFTLDDLMRIRNWHFAIRHYTEMVPRNVIVGTQDPNFLEQLSKNITRQGMTNVTLNYLRLCVILEPMQELMSRHKTYNLNPRECLKSTLFQRWQRMYAPPEYNQGDMVWPPNTPTTPGSPFPKLLERTLTGQPASKKDTVRPARTRRKRKAATANASTPNTGNNSTSNRKKSPSTSGFAIATQDVMVVGEPSLMGGEFGDEDERLITRLENTQYDTSNGVGDDADFGNSPMSGSPSLWNTDRKPNQDDNPGD
ncbi:LIM domain-binding protein 2-like isoform X2 [Acropora palmata]|uniref:LIM domain-binding protein 2-like isoform X2 n=1 Tax=Acropora palmata TaxID=6131 RepID=UPI003D9FD1FE